MSISEERPGTMGPKRSPIWQGRPSRHARSARSASPRSSNALAYEALHPQVLMSAWIKHRPHRVPVFPTDAARLSESVKVTSALYCFPFFRSLVFFLLRTSLGKRKRWRETLQFLQNSVSKNCLLHAYTNIHSFHANETGKKISSASGENLPIQRFYWSHLSRRGYVYNGFDGK